MDGMDFYEVLGVVRSASHQEIRQAYKREALRNHPDKNQDRVEEATEMFKLVSEAYSVLSDPQSRAEYDASTRQVAWQASSSTRPSRHRSDFTFNKASEVFREVFGEKFIAGLTRVARDAAPHVQAVAEATASAVATAWDRLNRGEPLPGGQVQAGQSAACAADLGPPLGVRAQAPVSATSATSSAATAGSSAAQSAVSRAPAAPSAAAPYTGGGNSYASTGVALQLDGDHCLHCTLHWATDTAAVGLDLSAYIVSYGGTHLGHVDGRLGQHALNVARQFRDCGIEHLGAALPPAAHRCKESILLDLRKLTQNDMFRCIFLRVGVQGGSNFALADLQVAVAENCQTLFTVEIARSATLHVAGGVVAAILIRDGEAWFAVPVLLPCDEASLQEAMLEKTLHDLASKAEDYLRKHRDEQREAEEAAAAIAAVEAAGACAGDVAAPTISMEDEQLAESVEVYAANGNYEGAVEGQEELIRRLMAYELRDVDSRWESRIAHEFTRMDELWKCIAGTSSPSQAALSRATSSLPSGSQTNGPRHPSIPVVETTNQMHDRFMVDMTPSHPESLQAQPVSSNAPAQTESKRAHLAPAPDEVSVPGPVQITPCNGSVKGGTRVSWCGNGPEPCSIEVDGRPCAPLDGGIYVVPCCRRELSTSVTSTETVDVRVVMADGRQLLYPHAFTYWLPGKLHEIEPPSGPVTGSRQLQITTSNLGAPISEVLIGGIRCELVGIPSASAVVVKLPASQREGKVSVCVQSSNGNMASSDECFHYYMPEAFGLVGENIQLSAEDRTVMRSEGVTGGVCISAFPLRSFPQGRYFEILVKDVTKSMRAMAVGILVGRVSEDKLHHGRIKVQEARELERVWLAGYDKGGAVFWSDGQESKLPANAWRPVRDVKVGTRLGVLWAECMDAPATSPTLVVFQDGEERLRLPAKGRVPLGSEEVYALVDVQGTTRCVSLVEGSSPPGASTDPVVAA